MTLPRQQQRAFTLMEILVATLIFSVLIAVLYGLLFSVIKLRQSASDAVDAAAPTHRLVQVLRADIENTVVPAGIFAGSMIITSEENGDLADDSIEFYTTTGIVSEDEPWGDIQKISLSLEVPEDESEGMDLVRLPTRNLMETTIDEDEEDANKQIVAHGVSSLSIEAYADDAWQETWDSTTQDNENPDGLRVRIEFETATGRAPIEIVVPILQHPRTTPTGAAPSSGGAPGGDSASGGSAGGGTPQ